MTPLQMLDVVANLLMATAAGALFFCSWRASRLWGSALDAQRAAQRERERLERERRRPSPDRPSHRCEGCGHPLGATARLADADYCERCRRDVGGLLDER